MLDPPTRPHISDFGFRICRPPTRPSKTTESQRHSAHPTTRCSLQDARSAHPTTHFGFRISNFEFAAHPPENAEAQRRRAHPPTQSCPQITQIDAEPALPPKVVRRSRRLTQIPPTRPRRNHKGPKTRRNHTGRPPINAEARSPPSHPRKRKSHRKTTNRKGDS